MLRLWLFTALVSIACSFLLDSGKKPNIIFLVADDLGFSDIGFRNGEIISPNIDRLAKEGVLLNSSYLLPTCSPSRAAIMTGRYPFKLGMQRVLQVSEPRCLPLNETLLPQRLQNLGYKTHAIGKWHLGFCNKECTPLKRGFDSFYGMYAGEGDKYTHRAQSRALSIGGFDFRDDEKPFRDEVQSKYSGHLFGNRALEIINKHKTEDPLFMWLAFQNVHTPVQVPDEYRRLYPGMASDKASYYGMVTIMDEYVGKVIETLKQRNMYDDSLIIFTTDNGGRLSSGGNNWPLRGEKKGVFEGGTRGVTLIDSPLLQKRGYVNNGLFHAIDWVPTLLHFAEGLAQSDPYLDGVDQFDMLNSGLPSKRTEFIYKLTTSAAIRDGDYKLITGNPGGSTGYSSKPAAPKTKRQNDAGTRKQNGRQGAQRFDTSPNDSTNGEEANTLLLFNLKDDPTESKDLSKTHPEIVEALQTKLESTRQYVVSEDFTSDDKSNPANFDNFWSPGWC